MKLWQKIFLCSLVLVIAAIDTISLVLVRNSQQLMLEREQSRCLESHENLSASIANRVVYQRLLLNKVLVDGETVQLLMEESLNALGSDSFGAWVELNGETVAAAGVQLAQLPDLPEDFVREGACSLLPVGTESGHYLLAASPLALEGNHYVLYTLSDITEIYTLRSRQMEFIRNMSLLFSCGTAAVLLVLVLRLLAPLRRLNTATRRIARGDYSVRVEEKGSVEFRELAHGMNTMAGAVEKNMAALQDVAESRKQFIANLAHEMKTPLTSILGFADILRISRRISESQRREYAGIIVEEASRLRALSGKLMELITMGNTALTLSQVQVRDMLGEIGLAMGPSMQAGEIDFVVLPCDATLSCDVTLVKSMLFNILDNAVKASEKGGRIILHAGKTETGVRFSVRDYGMGMPPEVLAKAMEPFYMADKSRSRKAGGAGLGLALCREVARVHGGELRIRSEPGQGTLVEADLPFDGREKKKAGGNAGEKEETP